MKLHRQLLTAAVAAALFAPAAHAEVAIDVIGGSEITFEGLVQADGNWFSNDRADLNGTTGMNGKDSEFELRRAELVLKGKGPGNVEWVVGYDAKADKTDAGYPKPIAGNWPGFPAGFTTGVGAYVLWGGGKAYFFKGKNYLRYDIVADKVDPGYPRPIAGNWPGMWADNIDAAVCWPGNGKAYFFKGSQYLRYDIAADKTDAGYPKPMAGNWPGFPTTFSNKVDAFVLWGGGKAYFFKGKQYLRYDVVADHVDPGYPRPIAGNWPGMWPEKIDAAICWPGNGKAYFFKGDQYLRYDIAGDKTDAGYPRPIAGNWPGFPADFAAGVQAAAVWNNGKAYFFKGSQYLRYDIAADKVDAGYPKPIAGNWPGFWPGGLDA